MNPTRKPLTLNDVFGYLGSLCSYWALHANPPPWADTDLFQFSYDSIDRLLFNTYGDRPISRLVAHYVDDSGDISADHAKAISWYLLDLFRPQWVRLTADYTAEYNPVQNYDMTETENSTNTASGTDTARDSYTDYKETQKLGHTVSTESATGIYGFDSATAVDSDTGNSTTTFGAAGDTGDEFSISGTKQNTFEHGKTDTFGRTLTRAGNIGVQTATDMLKSDTAFWSENSFYQQIVSDIASELTIPIYE